ncbi:MAG: rRNA maturation RNase YbeY [Spirochaetes bacterium]|nr:rRNA maturation RNase YbeY [Spirochaetota bacterium]
MSAEAARGCVEVVVSGIRSPAWRPRLAGFCAKLVARMGERLGDVSILLCPDARIAQLNRRYRGLDRPTDVLSFPRGDTDALSGDIAISLESLARNAAAYGVSRNEELKRLAIHGLLHLAGMDHGRGKGGAMLRLQARLAEEMAGERIIR